MIRIVRDHAGRYSVNDGGEALGLVIQQALGWNFRDGKGHGPRQPRSSPVAALELAVTLLFLPHLQPWRTLIREADQAFNHNDRVARKDAR